MIIVRGKEIIGRPVLTGDCDMAALVAPKRPTLIAHCDWGKDPKKRWMVTAVWTGKVWAINAPEPVGDTGSLIDHLRARTTRQGAIMIGFDFPIGLPMHYAQQLEIGSFRQFLQALATPEWAKWLSVCADAEDISLRRPFYPIRTKKKGEIQKAHLLDALGAANSKALLRRCERGGPGQTEACLLFWTLGANQVGKAMLAGWQEIIVPQRDRVAIWPFDGRLDQLLEGERVILCETYPADVYKSLNLPPKHLWAKSNQAGRELCAPALTEWLLRHADPSAELLDDVQDGFGSGATGEDAFDALVGLLGMIDVIEGRRAEAAPATTDVTRWEGWILGRNPLAALHTPA